MTAAEKLTALAPFARMDLRYPWMGQPWVYDGYAYASDTRLMARLPAPGEPDTNGLIAGPKFLRSLSGMYPAAEPHAFDAGDLRQWLGPMGRGEICHSCGIFPELTAEQMAHYERHGGPDINPVAVGPGCGDCSGGYDRPNADPVRVFGAVFDDYYLRLALNAPFVQDVRYGTFGTQEPIPERHDALGLPVRFAPRPASFTLGDARFLLMPMDLGTPEQHPAYHPGIGALWHLRNTDARCVLIDWCLERGVELTALEGIPF